MLSRLDVRFSSGDFSDTKMSSVTSSGNEQVDIVSENDTTGLGPSISSLYKGKAALNEKLESFKTALKDVLSYGYFVSTQWLSSLSDRETEDLNVALRKADYSQLDKTSTATYFKRHVNVCNNPEPGSETTSTSGRATLRNRETSDRSHGTGYSLEEKLQDFNMDDTDVTSKIQESK
jgi:hypothetical protein